MVNLSHKNPNGSIGNAVVSIWDDWNNERSGYFRAFWTDGPEGTSGPPVFGYASNVRGSYRTVRQVAMEVWRYYPGAKIYRNGREIMKRNPARATARTSRGDAVAAHELYLFIVNDGGLYRSQTDSIIKSLQRKIARGIYDPRKALKLWRYLANSGAKKYTREYGAESGYGIFTVPIRELTARELADHYKEQVMQKNPARRSHLPNPNEARRLQAKYYNPHRRNVKRLRATVESTGRVPQRAFDMGFRDAYAIFRKGKNAARLSAKDVLNVYPQFTNAEVEYYLNGYEDGAIGDTWRYKQRTIENPRYRKRTRSARQRAATRKLVALNRRSIRTPRRITSFRGLPIRLLEKRGRSWQTIAAFRGTPRGIRRAKIYARKYASFERVKVRLVRA